MTKTKKRGIVALVVLALVGFSIKNSSTENFSSFSLMTIGSKNSLVVINEQPRILSPEEVKDLSKKKGGLSQFDLACLTKTRESLSDSPDDQRLKDLIDFLMWFGTIQDLRIEDLKKMDSILTVTQYPYEELVKVAEKIAKKLFIKLQLRYKSSFVTFLQIIEQNKVYTEVDALAYRIFCLAKIHQNNNKLAPFIEQKKQIEKEIQELNATKDLLSGAESSEEYLSLENEIEKKQKIKEKIQKKQQEEPIQQYKKALSFLDEQALIVDVEVLLERLQRLRELNQSKKLDELISFYVFLLDELGFNRKDELHSLSIRFVRSLDFWFKGDRKHLLKWSPLINAVQTKLDNVDEIDEVEQKAKEICQKNKNKKSLDEMSEKELSELDKEMKWLLANLHLLKGEIKKRAQSLLEELGYIEEGSNFMPGRSLKKSKGNFFTTNRNYHGGSGNH